MEDRFYHPICLNGFLFVFGYLCVGCATGQEEWISTGLYLSPGMKTDIEFPQQIVGNGWKVMKFLILHRYFLMSRI